MSDSALRNAEADKKRLKEEIQRLSAELDAKRLDLAAAENFIKQWAKYAGPGTMVEENTGYEIPWKNPSRESVGRSVRTILLVAGRPLMRDELFRKLSSSGVEIRGADPKMILSTMLWRMPKQFVRLKGFGYWPADNPYEPAHYHPSRATLDEASNANTGRGDSKQAVT